MVDYGLSVASWWFAVLAVIALLRWFGWAKVNPGWLIVSVGISLAYFWANFLGSKIFSLDSYFGDLGWNWEGKLSAIVVSLLTIIILSITTKKVSFRVTGLTLNQNTNSFLPALVMTVILVGVNIGVEIAADDGAATDIERLLFQASMPGIDEEIFFRGIWLCTLAAAVTSRGVSILGAHLGWAGIIVTLFFGLGHSLFFNDGIVSISWIAFIYTGILGFGLLWLRERTGSVIFPIIAHNLINFSASFF